MRFEITIERTGWFWYWTVSDGPFEYQDATLTKRGAIWAANRKAKRWAKDKVNQLTKESWMAIV
jgi:hypothetical protein